jgi:spermidine synthase
MPRKQIVIIGGGFGGLTVAQSLRDVDVVLIDRTNHHLFQPLLYQVATSALSPGDIAWPLPTIFRRHPHVRVVRVKSYPSIVRRVSCDCKSVRRLRSMFLSSHPDRDTRILGATRGRNLRQDSRLSPMLSTFARRCCWHLRKLNADAWAPAQETDSPS